MNLEELRARLDQIEDELRTIHTTAGDGPLDETQQSQWDELDAERGQVSTQIEQRARREATVRALAARPENTESGDGLREANRGPEVMRRVEAFDGSDVRSLTRREATDKARAALDLKDRVRHLRTDQVDHVDQLVRTQSPNTDGSWIARMMLLTEDEHYRTGWQKMVTQANPVLSAEESRALNAVQEFRAMSGSTDTAGGFGVPILIDPTVILTAQGSLNPFRQIARQVTITTDAWNGVSSAGVTWSYDQEGTAVSDDSPTLAQPVVNVHEARGFIPFTIRVGQDYPGFADEMSRLLMEGYDELQAQKFAVGAGDGSHEPFGIITALDANTNVEVVTTTDGAYGGADVNKVWSALPDRYKANATWVMSYAVANDTAVFANANNWSFFTVDLTGQIEQIRNRPVRFSSYFPGSLATTGAANILVVGDFRNYLIVDRVGMNVELIPHLFDTSTGRPTGTRGWYAYARNGADSINDLGFRLLQNQ